jgi:urease accessory protein
MDESGSNPHLLAMLHLASPQLPVGGFSYSQGLEAAVDAGLITDAATATAWIESVFAGTIATWELPTLAQLHAAFLAGEDRTFAVLNADFIASRETRELREETLQMGWSLRSLLSQWPGCEAAHARLAGLAQVSFPAAFAAAACALGMHARPALAAYGFAWAENQVAAAIKAVPLGQVAGQKMLLALHRAIDAGTTLALTTPLDARSSFAPTLGILSSRHETQYSRLFRS